MRRGERGDHLVERILMTGGDETALALLEELWDGYPVTRIRPLLHSASEPVVKQGVWIASELGSRSAPVIDDLTPLLSHPSRYVRYFVLDAILGGATEEHRVAIAAALHLLRDPHEAVRRHALALLARVTTGQLARSATYVEGATVGPPLAWLLRLQNRAADRDDVVARLSDSDPLVRLFAAAAAARMYRYDDRPLHSAIATQDALVREFAQEEREFIEHMTRRERRRAGRSRSDK